MIFSKIIEFGRIWYFFINSFSVEHLSVIVLGLTLVIIGRYAIYTHRLLKESKHQTDLLVAPTILISFNFKEQKIRLINFGKGVALNIKISSIFQYVPLFKAFYELRFIGLDFIGPNSSTDLDYGVYTGTRKLDRAGQELLFSYIFRMGAKHIELVYDDSLGQRYLTQEVLDKQKCNTRIISISKSVWHKWLLYLLIYFARCLIAKIKIFLYRNFLKVFPKKSRIVFNKNDVRVFKEASVDSEIIYEFASRDEPILFTSIKRKGGQKFYFIHHTVFEGDGMRPIFGYICGDDIERLVV